MSRTVPERGRLTDLLVAHMQGSAVLTDKSILLGDGIAPADGGWSKMQPGEDEFVGYVLLSTGQAVPAPTPETMRGAHTTWRCLYGLRSVGGSRKQADFVADKAREAFLAFPTDPVDLGEQWNIMQLRFERLAAVRPQKQGTDNAEFVLDDLAEIWITRSAR